MKTPTHAILLLGKNIKYPIKKSIMILNKLLYARNQKYITLFL